MTGEASRPAPQVQTDTPASEAAPPPASGRLSAVDVFRGLTITEVVGHHTSGMALRYATLGTPEHEFLSILNRSLHFAVPAFVFLSVAILTNSLLKRFDARRYFWRRLTRGLWPYLLWSALYVLWSVWTGQRPPEVLTDPGKWSFYLLYGKASYHLYFLLVALEVYLLLPLLLPLARKKPYITAALGLGLLAQWGAYELNRGVWQLQFPASTVLWYLLPVLLGVGVGARFAEFPAWWRRRWPVLVLLTALAYAAYLPTALDYLSGDLTSSTGYNVRSWLYTSLTALTLLGAAFHWQELAPRLRGAFGWLGTVSLQIYLLHPAALQLLERWQPPAGSGAQRLWVSAGYGLLALLLPALLARLLRRTPLSPLLFGR